MPALPCDQVVVVCLVALVLSLSGCTKHREEPYLVLESASIVGPEGRIELEAATKRSKGSKPRWHLDMWAPAVNNEHLLSFHPFARSSAKMYIKHPIGASGPSFDIIEILYQLNDGDEIELEILEARNEDYTNGWSAAYLRFMRSSNLADINNQEVGSHVPRMIERINDQKGDLHRFYIKFIINDVPYVLDASFKIKLDTIWYSDVGSFGGLP